MVVPSTIGATLCTYLIASPAIMSTVRNTEYISSGILFASNVNIFDQYLSSHFDSLNV